MPVTAKLSQKFYERLGDEIANELVDWFNAVDATYRADLHQVNELNFARFDAKLEQRIAQLDAKLERKLAQLEAKLEQQVARLDAKIDLGLAGLRADLAAQRAELIKWMFVFWTGTVVPLGGLIVALHLL